MVNRNTDFLQYSTVLNESLLYLEVTVFNDFASMAPTILPWPKARTYTHNRATQNKANCPYDIHRGSYLAVAFFDDISISETNSNGTYTVDL